MLKDCHCTTSSTSTSIDNNISLCSSAQTGQANTLTSSRLNFLLKQARCVGKLFLIVDAS